MAAQTDDPNAVALAKDPTQKPKPSVADPLAPASPTASPLSLTPSAGASAPLPLSGASSVPKVATDTSPAQTAMASATQNTADPLAFAPTANSASAAPTAAPAAAPTLPGGGASTQPVTPPAPTADPLGGASTAPAGTAHPAAASTAPQTSFTKVGPQQNYAFDGTTGMVRDEATNQSIPIQQYIDQYVAQNPGSTRDDAILHAIGPSITGIQSTIGGHTQYAAGRSPFDLDAYLKANAAPPTTQPPPTNTPPITDPIGQPSGPPTSSTTGPNVGVGNTPTDPLNALTQQTITPNNTVDRVKLARDAFNSAVTNDLNPKFQADLRDTAAQSFGAGRGVSGMNRTRLGNVQSDYEHTKAGLENSLITGATNGSIDDMYKNLGIAQQQQGFQAGQQQTAFNQNYSLQQLSDSERQQLFNEAMQQFYAGNISDPAQFYEYIAGQYARPAGAAA